MSTTTRPLARPAHRRLATAALVAGVSLLGLTACELPTSSTVVRTSRSTAAERETTTTSTDPGSTGPWPSSSAPPISLPPVETTPVTVDTTPVTPETTPVTPDTAAPQAVPAGSLDLGDGVFVPVSAGWTGTVTDGVVRLTDGSADVLLQVVRRQPGEDPRSVVDEYVAASIDPIGTVSYSPVTLRWSTESPRPAVEYGFYYTSFDPAAAEGKGIDGGVSVYIRNDGLTLIYDVWAASGVSAALADDSFNGLLDSFLAAPEAAAPVAPALVADFRVTTVSDEALVGQVAGFTAAPGFAVQAEEAEYALVASATSEFAVLRSTGRTDEVDALATGMAVVLGLLPEAQFADDETFHEPNGQGVARSTITFTSGARVGWVTVFFDSTTGNSYSIVAVWDASANAAADTASASFMLQSMANSFTNIA